MYQCPPRAGTPGAPHLPLLLIYLCQAPPVCTVRVRGTQAAALLKSAWESSDSLGGAISHNIPDQKKRHRLSQKTPFSFIVVQNMIKSYVSGVWLCALYQNFEIARETQLSTPQIGVNALLHLPSLSPFSLSSIANSSQISKIKRKKLFPQG